MNLQVYLNQLKDTDLIDLVQSQSPQIINQVLQSYSLDDEKSKLAKINKIDQEGYTALHKACARGVPEIVEMLLSYGIEVNIRNIGGETAALLAAKRGNPVVLKWLKDFGSDFNVVDLKGQGIVHHSIYNDNVYVLLWIEASTDVSFNSRDKHGHTPLHLACILGKVNCTKFLLRKSRCQIMEKTSVTRDTCLHLSIANNQLQCLPHLIFHNTRKKPLFDSKLLQTDDKTSWTLCKNAESKTPIDLFMEKSQTYKSTHRQFWYFFVLLQITSLQILELNCCMYRCYLFLFPFLAFSLGILLSSLFLAHRVYLFIVVSVLCLCYVRIQGHRTNDIDIRPNPIFAGAYMAGVFHDLLCFVLNIYPSMHGTEWEIVATVVILPLFAIAYLRLIFVDPGRLKLSETSPCNLSQFINNEVAQQKLKNLPSTTIALDRFCNVCEVLPAVDRVKHCKICNLCIVDLDHHCLFLMKCIGRNNLRNFIVLILLSVTLMVLFIETSLKTMIMSCGPLSGANPIEFALCSYKSQTWIVTAVLFNTVSALWATFMLVYQLSMISHNSTAYFHLRTKKATICQRMIRIVYFMLHGTFYHSKEGNKTMSDV